jgi:hypothetical protein
MEMNKRIGQLAEESGLLGPRSRVGDAHKAAEKFAELIIAECVAAEFGIDIEKGEWVGLTDEEVFAIAKELGLKCSLGGNPNIDIDYAKAIEAKLKEKNT